MNERWSRPGITFGQLLRKHRTAAGITQGDLAERARLSEQGVGALERGSRRAPYDDTAMRLADALNLTDGLRSAFVEAAKRGRARSASPKSTQTTGHNLPRQLTSFVGREREVAEIETLLEHCLVTLVGTGGAGKTRCAVQVGARLLDGWSGGVWMVELAPLSATRSSPEPCAATRVASAIAQALGVPEAPDRPVLDALLGYLKRQQLLLILDNCEHVIDQARMVVPAILRGCPHVHVLATSREALGIAGERIYRMPSLATPPGDGTLPTQLASRYGAMLLFADRARAADFRFELSDENAPFVAQICRRLDGLPLAIELAAARVKILSPQALLEKLDERFRLLTGGDRSALPRHRTMRALMDWSYDLLTGDERRLFRALSIFAGGFSLETASAICAAAAAGGPIDELAVMHVLSSLVDKSLVQADPQNSGTRYRLLESPRAYAREKLRETGEEIAVVRAHAAIFAALAEELARAYETTPDRAWEARVEPDLENWRATLEWAFGAHGDVRIAQRLAGELDRTWRLLGLAEGRRSVRAALQTVDDATPPAVVAKLDVTEAWLDSSFAQYKASYAAAQRALERYRALGDSLGIAWAQRLAGWALVTLGRIPEGEALLSQALMAARELGARKLIAIALTDLGWGRGLANDLPGAQKYYGEALWSAKACGAERTVANVAGNLAELTFRGGDAVAALRLAGEALAAYRSLNDKRNVGVNLSNLAAYLVALGRAGEARAHARESIALSREAQSEVMIAFAMQHLAALAVLCPAEDEARENASRGSVPHTAAAAELDRERYARAARLLGYVNTRVLSLEAHREYTEQREYDELHAALRETFGDHELAKLMHQGSAWSEDQAAAEALLL